MCVNIKVPSNPQIEAILQDGIDSYSRPFPSKQRSINFEYNTYYLYDFSQLYKEADQIIPKFSDVFQPITMKKIKVKNQELREVTMMMHYQEDSNLLVHVFTFQNNAEMHFFNTSQDLVNPEYIGKFTDRGQLSELSIKNSWMTMNQNSTLLYVLIRNVDDKYIRLLAVDISNPSDAKLAGSL